MHKSEPPVKKRMPPREAAREHFDVVVIGAGQAGLAIGYFLARQGRRFVILEAADSVGCGVAEPMGLASPVHAAPVRQPARAGVPRRSRRLPDARRGDRLSRALRGDLRAPGRAEQRRALADREGRQVRGRTRRPADRSRPGRRGHRPVPGAARAGVCRRSRAGGVPDAQHRLPAGRATSRRERFSSSAAATPASRSRKSSPAPTRSSSRSAPARRRCRRGFSAATCSGG